MSSQQTYGFGEILCNTCEKYLEDRPCEDYHVKMRKLYAGGYITLDMFYKMHTQQHIVRNKIKVELN